MTRKHTNGKGGRSNTSHAAAKPSAQHDPPKGIDPPKPTRHRLRLEQLRFLEDLQMREVVRDGGEVLLFDEDTVARYVEDMTPGDGHPGDEFPPLEVVRDTAKGGETYYVIAGFNRGEAYRRRGVNSVDCLVYAGTLDDARLWALRQNSKHPKERTDGDRERALLTLVGKRDLLRRVAEDAKFKAGLSERSIAAACGISQSTAHRLLKKNGLRVRAGRVEPITGADTQTETPVSDSRITSSHPGQSEQEGAIAGPAAPAGDATGRTEPVVDLNAVTLDAARSWVSEALAELAKVQKRVGWLLATPHADRVREVAASLNCPVTRVATGYDARPFDEKDGPDFAAKGYVHTLNPITVAVEVLTEIDAELKRERRASA